MTSQELRDWLNKEYSINSEWPRTLNVSYETYCNVANDIFENAYEKDDVILMFDISSIRIWIGPNFKLMFKNIELIPTS